MTDTVLRKWFAALAAMVALSLFAHGVAHADTNPTPMAVPAIGTSGPASLYPSTIEVTAPQGPNFKTHMSVKLIGVQHPCPRELAVLLVHNGVDAYPLMYNAGGCHALDGATLWFDTQNQTMLPENPLPNAPMRPPYITVAPSRYGTMPAFPAPAPASARIHPAIPELVTVNGSWSLYVIDTGGSGRGAIEGWALVFSHNILNEQGRGIDVPGSSSNGQARQYPIDFDLSGVNPNVKVDPSLMTVYLELQHDRPRELQILLEAPTGQRVILMANAGGATPIKLPIVFDNYEGSPEVPYERPIEATIYRPGGAYDKVSLAPPAPQLPYDRSFNVFNGIPVAGIWKLWVYDTNPQNYSGRINAARLGFSFGNALPAVTFSANTPATATVTQPFVRVEAKTERVLFNGYPPSVVMWRVTNGGSVFAAGRFDFKPGSSDIIADVPVKKGENRIDVIPFNGFEEPTGISYITRTVKEFTYALAEGATGGFFDLDITMANAGNTAAPLAIDFLPEGGTPIMTTNNVAANAPLQIHADQVTDDGATSTIVRSLDAVPLAIERTMSWDARGYGGHGGGAVSPATRWLFAEGAQGFLKTYILLANDNAKAVAVTVKFLLEGGGVVTHVVNVPARSRETIDAGSLPDVVNRSFGLDITADAPIIAERAMYFSMGTNRLSDGGHESAGVNETSTRWFLAEGATGAFFDCFVLLSNPNDAAARVRLTYLLADGATYVQDLRMAPNSRETINVETVAPLLANAAVSTTVTSDIGIVAERAMYWPNVSEGWREAHNSFGVTRTGLRWGLADGRLGGARGYATFILLANPNPHEAEVRVRFLQAGSETTRTYKLPRTSRLTIQAADIAELREGVFGAEIQVLNFQPIAVEKALYWNAEGVIWAAGTNVTATPLPPQ